MKLTDIFEHFKPHKKLFILDFTSAFFMAMIDLAFPVFTQRIIDVELPNKNYKFFIILIVILVILQGIRAILAYIVTYYGHKMGVNIRYDMRNKLFRHLQKLSLSYYDNAKTGTIMSRVMGDLEILSELAHHGPEDLFIIIVTFIGSFILMINLNVTLTLVVFAILPFYIYFVIKENKKMKRAFKDYRVVSAEVNSHLEDSIAGVRVVKAFGNEKTSSKNFDGYNKKVADSLMKAFEPISILTSATGLFSGGIQIIILVLGGTMVMKGQLTIGILIAFLLFVNRFLDPIKRIISFLEMYQQGTVGYERFCEVMDIDPDIKDSEGAKNLEDISGNLEFKSVDFSYNDGEVILKDFNLDIKAGEKVALVGPSGAGKSTICSLLPRFYDVSRGEIIIDGVDVKMITQNSLRKNIGIVQQDVYLFHGTIGDNIGLGKIDASEDEIERAASMANALEFINELPNGMNTLVGERGVKLSGGQKQRISIARIFLKNPKILILDEATSALDNQTEKYIQDSLAKLSEGRTTLTIAHRLTTIKNSDNIIYLDKDGIQEEGTHEELIEKKGKYEKLYNSEFHGFV
ncbi:ABC transporter ATP-binding protein [Psychrilyobacter atlanticus]|uniref:ABC transporter ATP-binding protein n=1 Tax=Psychrilyobacter atlanticus TaxID=271091 RepID=UPI000427B734|nr:ABC transporter ATP-binding protein [Psychrilyobacter atlanticus]